MTDLAVRSWRKAGPDYFGARAPGTLLGRERKRHPVEVARKRLWVAGVIFALCFTVLGARIVDLSLQGAGGGPPPVARDDLHATSLKRVDIVDRNGALLATNLPAPSLYVDPALVLDAEEAADKLSAVLTGVDREIVIEKATGGGRFAWIHRYLTPDQTYEVNRLGLPGFAFQREERRVYPYGPLFGHALGFTDTDNRALAGFELALEDRLVPPDGGEGKPVAVALDLRLQHVVAEELSATMQEFRAVGGTGIVMDVDTGEVLAMVSLPSFDPNESEHIKPDQLFNRATLGVYELGSTFKAFTTAMALDYGVATLGDQYDATEPLHISRFTIRDDHPENRWLTLPEVLIHSSNIGAALMARDIGAERQKAFLAKLGMFDPLPLELTEAGRPLAPQRWGEVRTMTVGFGHGIAVTPMHLITGFAAMVNGGILRTPTLLKYQGGDRRPGRRVIAPETSRAMRDILRLAVTEGTGKQADAAGYVVGGKTGTAEKAVGGHYDRSALISTFVGAFPMNAPRYAVLAMLDEPKGNASTYNFATAGWTAAPLVGRMITRIAPLLGIPPADPAGNVPRPEELIVEAQDGRQQLASF